ncbi:MAG: SH3 domain-containing protein, partial [Cyanobacteria bacterium J06555_13]
APVTAQQVDLPTYQQLEQQKTQVVSPLAKPPTAVNTHLNPRENHDQTVMTGRAPVSNNNTNKRLSPVMIGAIAAAVGASAMSGGLLMSRSAGDSSLQSPPIKTASTSPDTTSPDTTSSDTTSSSNRDNAATKLGERTTQLSSKMQSTDEGTSSLEVSLSDTRIAQSGQPESAVTPDNPDEPTFDYPVFFREDLRTDRVNVYARVDDRGEPLHYGLPGDRVILLEQVNRPDTIWNRVRFESGAEGWVPQEVIAWDQTPPALRLEEAQSSTSPSYGWLAGLAPGNQVDIYPAPMFDPGPEHYGLVGDRVAILDTAKGYDDGLTWYRVGFDSGAVGWVRNDFIALP